LLSFEEAGFTACGKTPLGQGPACFEKGGFTGCGKRAIDPAGKHL
jgi:hypothetical protein